MQRNSRDQHVEAVLEEIKHVGGVVNRIERRNHISIYWMLGDRRLIQVLSGSSCSRNATRHAQSDIRRQARAILDAPFLRCDTVL